MASEEHQGRLGDFGRKLYQRNRVDIGPKSGQRPIQIGPCEDALSVTAVEGGRNLDL